MHHDKLRHLMLEIAAHPGVKRLGLTKLWKLIYFVDVASLREHGSTITGSEFVKYPHGPVPSRGEKMLRAMRREGLLDAEQGPMGSYTQTFITAVAKPTAGTFSKDEHEIIDRVCRELGAKTAKALSDLSHQEPAWAAASDLGTLDDRLMYYGRSEDPEGL